MRRTALGIGLGFESGVSVSGIYSSYALGGSEVVDVRVAIVEVYHACISYSQGGISEKKRVVSNTLFHFFRGMEKIWPL